MEKNIFNNAYFGKPYKMRNGNKAIFHRNANNRTWYLICEEIHDRIPYNVDGTSRGDNCFDIVSEWQEEINEEELDKLAYQSASPSLQMGIHSLKLYKDGFKACYRNIFRN